ncbi:Fungal specific transcription factor domain-containing protein 45 [Elsinoe fawcettii]|nr:Fungal specific transcription factor domain-containing protein 45 [Elsinoe fawcettii]
MPETSSTPSTSAGPAKRACDACHRRKVKCINPTNDSTRPCKNCAAAGLSCTYNSVPQKKGPKGSRARVIGEIREIQRQQSQVSGRHSPYGPDTIQTASPLAPTPGLLTPELIGACVEFFFSNMYPSQPILHRQRLAEVIGQMDNSVEAYCLVSSLCAYMLIQPHMVLPVAPDAPPGTEAATLPTGQALLQETLRVRKAYDYIENPSVLSVITSFFLFGSYFCLDKNNTAWFHLREATTLAYDIHMHEEDSYAGLDPVESSRRRRLYWLLFVTERAYALQRHRPLTLYSTIQLPSMEEDPSETVELSGFLHLVQLFRPFDDTFVGFWNKTKVGCTTDWLVQLQKQLSTALPSYLESTETQAVDLRVSQQWLKTMIWQLSISQGYLSSQAQDQSMTFNFPLELSRDLVASASSFSQMAMEVHGIGLIEKLFDVACTLTDVMSCVPEHQLQPSFEFGPRDYLHQLVSLVSNLRGGRQRYLPLLVSKIHETLPSSMSNMSFALSPNPSHDSPSYMGAGHHGHVEEVYGQQAHDSHGSGQTSHVASPFGSPPQSATLPMAAPPFSFENLSVAQSPVGSPGYAPVAGPPMMPTSYPVQPQTSAGFQQPLHTQQSLSQEDIRRSYGFVPPGLKYEHTQ